MKAWWQSKTIWFNLVMAVLASLEATFHLLQPVFGSVLYGFGAVFVAVVNAALRVVTSQPVALKVPANDAGQQ